MWLTTETLLLLLLGIDNKFSIAYLLLYWAIGKLSSYNRVYLYFS
jgi:hypothetical protein